MSILKDIMDTIKDVDIAGSVDEYFKKKKYSSIAKRSLEGTLQFPDLVSRSLDIQTLQMINKALERQYASFVQIVLTMSPTLRLDKEGNIANYLRQFHQNSDVKTDLHDVMNFGVDVLKDNYNCYSNNEETRYLLSAVYEGSTGAVVASNKEQLGSVLEHVSFDKLNDKFIPKGNYLYKFANESLTRHHNQIVREDLEDDRFAHQQQQDYIKNRLSQDKSDLDMAKFGQQLRQDAIKNDLDKEKIGLDRSKFAHQKSNDAIKNKLKPKDLDVTMVPTNILKDNDVKKSNELVPTTLHIRVNTLNKDDESAGYVDCVIGVKTTMHPIDSNEMITNMVNACKNNNKFFDFIRWTSGEISFFKDFLFNIKEIKDDVLARSNGSSGWWITLKRKRALAKIKNTMMLAGQILPNATIVLSMEEVEFIKSNYGYDLMNESFVTKIMDTYFLLGFVVVDNSTQIAHFKFDGQTNFQSITFTGLERENSNHANDFKEMLKLVNRY